MNRQTDTNPHEKTQPLSTLLSPPLHLSLSPFLNLTDARFYNKKKQTNNINNKAIPPSMGNYISVPRIL